MLDNILSQVKGVIGSDLMEKFGLSSSDSEKAANITKEVVKETVEKEASGGFMDGVMNLFSSEKNNEKGDSVMEKLSGNLVSKLSSGLGVSQEKAGGMKDSILEKIMPLISSKMGSGFEFGDLLSFFGGKKDSNDKDNGTGGLLDKVKGFFK